MGLHQCGAATATLLRQRLAAACRSTQQPTSSQARAADEQGAVTAARVGAAGSPLARPLLGRLAWLFGDAARCCCRAVCRPSGHLVRLDMAAQRGEACGCLSKGWTGGVMQGCGNTGTGWVLPGVPRAGSMRAAQREQQPALDSQADACRGGAPGWQVVEPLLEVAVPQHQAAPGGPRRHLLDHLRQEEPKRDRQG